MSAPTVTALSTTPVKGLRVVARERVGPPLAPSINLP